ncbi:cytochrome c biogenesis protein CcdA [Rhizobium sp. Root1220]|uniref:redoxin domain-containing protein n=1 Tax=Rhizobium sp. Root1220 TaxID=1736432 RepID=UPI0006F47EC5|nr:cytochrome c biogenesis protein CcdA [Rhizobium sp. Root1220]KQV68105.1 cytochrome C biogenesis protein [Rhizobium sp. Root1220]
MTLLVIAYLGGVLTILSPCILPVLPFVFARAGQPFLKGTVPMLAGMALTFAAVATLAAVGGSWVIHANEYGRYIALALLAVFGVTLVSPTIAARLTQPVVAFGDNLSRSVDGHKSVPTAGSSLVLGVATGLLWAPCAGPILGLVLTGAALQGANVQTTLLLLAYAGGAVTSLAVALLIGGRIFARMKQSLGTSERMRQGVGVAVLAGVASIALGLDTGVLASFSYASTTRVEQALVDKLDITRRDAGTLVASNSMTLAANDARRNVESDLPVEGRIPSLDGAVEWLNSAPLTAEQLRGKVVLVDFWTYSCINCIRTIPYVRAWAEKYKDQGLVVIGVHSPEFAFEKKIDNVKDALKNFDIGYPVAVDNNFKIWRAFDNSYWPAHYFIDAKGQIRYHHFGEGDYERSEEVIQELLAEANGQKTASELIKPDASGAEAAADFGNVRSPETYVGYKQATNFVSGEPVKPDAPQVYTTTPPALNQWALSGNWTVEAEQATLNQPDGGIVFRFSARDLHLVLGPNASGKPVRFKVTVDGKPPGNDHGADIDAAGNGAVTDTRLYQLVRQADGVKERDFEIRFLDPGVEAFVFTFG